MHWMNGSTSPAFGGVGWPVAGLIPRRRAQRLRVLAVAGILAFTIPSKAFAVCTAPVAVQVLGSGGPDSNDARASSGYLLWLDGEARLLVDAGGGVFLRFGEAKARFESLDVTHLHVDHVSDLAALLMSGFFGDSRASAADHRSERW
jgi:glyoxylase-like metal-dependent hydrolase (beta-lactamase superfamily II)